MNETELQSLKLRLAEDRIAELERALQKVLEELEFNSVSSKRHAIVMINVALKEKKL